MLILAEFVLPDAQPADELIAAWRAWLGPMVDDGFLLSGYVDVVGRRLWMVVSDDTMAAARHRIEDVSGLVNGLASFTMTEVTALRFR